MLTHVRLDYDNYPFAGTPLKLDLCLFIILDVKIYAPSTTDAYITHMLTTPGVFKCSLEIGTTQLLVTYSGDLFIPFLDAYNSGYLKLKHHPVDCFLLKTPVRLSALTINSPIYIKGTNDILQAGAATDTLQISIQDGVTLTESSDSTCDYVLLNLCILLDTYDVTSTEDYQTTFMDKINYIQAEKLAFKSGSLNVRVHVAQGETTVYVYIGTNANFLGCKE